MRKRFLALATALLSCATAHAFFPEATASSFDVGFGYRQDKLDWKTKTKCGSHSGSGHSYSSYSYSDYYSSSESGSSESCCCEREETKIDWKNLRTWMIEARGKYITCDNVYLRGSLDYGWITSGKTHRDFSFDDEESGDDYYFSSCNSSKVKGHVYDAKIAIGYLWQFCDNSFSVAPVIGYSWHGQHVHNRDHDGSSYGYGYSYSGEGEGKGEGECTGKGSGSSSSGSRKNHFQARWNGLFLGLDADYRLCNCWTIFGSYEFHWAHYRGHGEWKDDIELGKFRQHAKSGIGNVIDIGVEWALGCDWLVSLRGEFQWWHVHHGKDYRKIEGNSEGCAPLMHCDLENNLRHFQWKSAAVIANAGISF